MAAIAGNFNHDLTGLIRTFPADSNMTKTKPATRTRLKPLATGQVWRMPGSRLQVGMIGKFLVHYKIAKPNAVRIPNSVSGISTVEEFLRKNKAVLMRASSVAKEARKPLKSDS